MRGFLAAVLLASAACSSPTSPTGVWTVTTHFADGRTYVSTCHSERGGRIVVCDPPLPFRVP